MIGSGELLQALKKKNYGLLKTRTEKNKKNRKDTQILNTSDENILKRNGTNLASNDEILHRINLVHLFTRSS